MVTPMGRLGDVIWFCWTIFYGGVVKDKCYANQGETIEALKHEIQGAIDGLETN